MVTAQKRFVFRTLGRGAALVGLIGLAGTTPFARASPAAQQGPACLAIMPPVVEGFEAPATQAADATRDLFVSMLAGPSTPVVPLDARLTARATEEARQKGCSQILMTKVVRKRAGGGRLLGRVVGQAGSVAAWSVPGAGAGVAVTRSAAAASAAAAAELASGTRAKDEMELEYRLTSNDGRVVLKPRKEKLKASSDGEDLLTPLVQRAAEFIAGAAK